MSRKDLMQWQNQLIDQIVNQMENYYCLPQHFSVKKEEVIQKLATSFLSVNQQRGASEKPASKEEYQPYLDAINTTLGHFDPHLEVNYERDFIESMIADEHIVKTPDTHAARFDFGDGPPQSVLLEMNDYRSKPENNYGFLEHPKEEAIIPDNIGYVRIEALLDPRYGANETEEQYRLGPNAVSALDTIMNTFEDKQAVIIDLRGAPEGGSPEMVQYIVSSFIEEKGKVINEIEDRLTGTTVTYKTIETPHHLFNMPIDILTDGKTFSACEETAYDFQQLNIQLQREGKQQGDRFQIIGEPTYGGAHPEFAFPLVDASDHMNEDLVLRIPYARSVNPTTGTNWEEHEGKKGVQPDQRVPKEQALTHAITHLQLVIHSDNEVSHGKKPAWIEAKRAGVDISDEEMARSAFGQGSKTAQDFKKPSL